VALTCVQPSPPDSVQLAAVRTLLDALAAETGRDPLSDQALTKLGSASVEHALAYDGEQLVGYAQLDGDSLEIGARPDAIGALLDVFADRPALVWSHGRTSSLASVLDERGFVRERELYQLRRSLGDPIEAVPAPDGIELRPFAVGTDEDDWVRVNAAAFAHHPEQGSWTRTDLEARERDSWFDPSGFFLAWRGDELLGFHWTKVHPDGAGEVYVIGVDPSAQGLGLGRVLLLRGLGWLRERGCPEVLLYVDGTNTGARRLYERYGFREHDLDVQWRSPESA
jgi:mycothiol synthase